MHALKISLIQFRAGPEGGGNIARLNAMIEPLPAADLIALPEVFNVRGGDADYRAAAEPIPGPTTEWLSGVAAARGAWVLGGSLIERDGDAVYNTCVLVDRAGEIRARYRKMHLFEATLDTGESIREADTYAAGPAPVMADVEGWRCGLSICYDLRFPELYRHYAGQGAHLLFVPANFTLRTGRDHWEVLLRARAIENQCFVAAPNQCGANARTGVASYGHSLAVDPWGETLGDAGEGETAVSVTLDPERLTAVRGRIPVLQHRRM
jgi:predicted amidohydrolase